MQYKQEFLRRSEEEYIKDQGLVIDYDEIARKGKMSKEEALISKWYGVYQSRQAGDCMARIVLPGGQIKSSQVRKIAEVSRKYSKGLISITTRQAVQLHFLQVDQIANLMRDIAPEGLSTFHGCGDVTRTISTCALAETCSYKRTNVRPHAVETMRYLTSFRDLDNLPRKYKITFSGCSANCAQPYMNCVGIVAVQTEIEGKLEVGFSIKIGGGMGWKAFVAQELFSFVPEESIKEVCRAIAIFYREEGDRFNRATSRLKFVVDRLGILKSREMILDIMKVEKISAKGIQTEPIIETGIPFPKRPLTIDDPIGTDGKATVHIMTPKGEFTADQFLRIAELSEIYANQKIYTDNRQNLSLQGVDTAKIQALKAEVHKLGFKTEGYGGLTDIVSCVGKDYCPKAVTSTRALFDDLQTLVDQEKYKSILKKAFINITGCPNSCSPFRIADIGFRGQRIRTLSGSVEGYEVLLGGSDKEHGQKLGDYKKEDCLDIVAKVLNIFLEQNEGDETLGDYVKRVGILSIKECVDNEVSL